MSNENGSDDMNAQAAADLSEKSRYNRVMERIEETCTKGKNFLDYPSIQMNKKLSETLISMGYVVNYEDVWTSIRW